MTGIDIDWAGLEHSFENHAPDVRSYLDKKDGAIVTVSDANENDPALLRVQAHPEQYLFVEPIPSREQYRMMEQFIDTVPAGTLKTTLGDAIVGKGAFRRFKDAIGRFPDERKRWFAFRDILLRQFILDWVKANRILLAAMPDWNLELPSAETPASDEPPPAVVSVKDELVEDVKDYLQSWARAHGAEHRYLFGPAAFDRLAEDIANEYNLSRREK